MPEYIPPLKSRSRNQRTIRYVEITLKMGIAPTETNAEAVKIAEEALYKALHEKFIGVQADITSITVVTN